MSGLLRMAPAWGPWGAVRLFLCSALAGLAIKIMDDWLDRDRGEANFAVRLGPASLPYALALLALSAVFDAPTAVSLFLMAYALGMAWDCGLDRYPTGLLGWQESVLAAAVATIASGWRIAAVAGMCMAAVQALDDVIDYQTEGPAAAPLARTLGLVECCGGAAGLLLLSLALDPPRTVGAVLGALCVWTFERLEARD